MLAVCNVKDYDKSTKLLASTTLRFVYNVKKLFFNVISTVCLHFQDDTGNQEFSRNTFRSGDHCS